jgi:hypothetical protein
MFYLSCFPAVCFGLGIHHFTTTPCHPNPSYAERFNRNLRSYLIAYHTFWDSELYWLQFAFNTARHEAHDCIPFSLTFGFISNNPLSNIWYISYLLPDKPDSGAFRELWSRVKRNIRRSHERQRLHYDRDRKDSPLSYMSRLLSYMSMLRCVTTQSRGAQKFAAELAPRFRGPFQIVRFLTPVMVLLCGRVNYCL